MHPLELDVFQKPGSDVVPLSLAPGFSRVLGTLRDGNRFNGFSHYGWETVETVACLAAANTRLKPGANERAAREFEKRLIYPGVPHP